MTPCCPICPHLVTCDDLTESVFARPEEITANTCALPGCDDRPNRNGMCGLHARVRIASAWSAAGEDEGHKRGEES